MKDKKGREQEKGREIGRKKNKEWKMEREREQDKEYLVIVACEGASNSTAG